MADYYQQPPSSWSDEQIRDYYDTTTVTLSTLAEMTGKTTSELKSILMTEKK